MKQSDPNANSLPDSVSTDTAEVGGIAEAPQAAQPAAAGRAPRQPDVVTVSEALVPPMPLRLHMDPPLSRCGH